MQRPPSPTGDLAAADGGNINVARPLGDVLRFDSEGLKHYGAFEFNTDVIRVFEIGMTVLMTPEYTEEHPYIAVIKDIVEETNGRLSVSGQWLYRPVEAKKEGGGHWEAKDDHEVFYSFHVDKVPAETVMHQCAVHFIPLHKRIPPRREHPGMYVQKVYDVHTQKLLNLRENAFGEDEQHAIDQLLQKTVERLGELPDLETESSSLTGDHSKNRKNLHKRKFNQVSPVQSTTKFEDLAKAYSPRTAGQVKVSKYHAILSKCNQLTGDAHRDKWLENLLFATQHASSLKEVPPQEGVSNLPTEHVDINFCWPEDAIPIVVQLERFTYESGLDFSKYNQKMRQLDNNLKASHRLVRRLMMKELDPISLLTMSPQELKEGLTAEEKNSMEDKPENEIIRMTGNICQMCNNKQVGVTSVRQAGKKGECYQLKCVLCGNEWSCFQDAVIFDS